MEWDMSLLIYGLVLGLGAGAVAGMMAGLAGVGGGLVYVPVFYLLMPDSSDGGMALAIFFSMVAIALTSIFSARSHWRLGHVNVRLAMLLCPSLLLGASMGLWSALILPEVWVLVGLAALNTWVAYDYGRSIQSNACYPGVFAILGLPIGYISGVFGVAGGTMLVPLLRRSLNLQQAVGTSALCGAVMVSMAVIFNMIGVADWRLLLSQQWTFLSVACIGILITMPPAARISAGWHNIFQEHQLRFFLKAMFACLAVFFCAVAWFK